MRYVSEAEILALELEHRDCIDVRPEGNRPCVVMRLIGEVRERERQVERLQVALGKAGANLSRASEVSS